MKKYTYTGEHRSMACRQLLTRNGVYELDSADSHVASLVKAGLLVSVDEEEIPVDEPESQKTKTKKKKK